MTEKNNSLDEVLSKFDASGEPIAEHDVSKAIRQFLSNRNTSPMPVDWLAEAMAFDFCENYQNKENGWGTYYGPMMVLYNGDGTVTESPSIKHITPEIIDYWLKRSNEAKHPVLRARYADLVRDFSTIVTGKPAHYTVAHAVIDSIVQISQHDMYSYDVEVITKLEHALALSINLNDPGRVANVRDAIITYEDKVAEDDKAGLWGFSYDLLWGNKKVSLTEEQAGKIVFDLETRLNRLAKSVSDDGFNPWPVQFAALRLASHYRTLEQQEEVRRVLTLFGSVFEQASEAIDAFRASVWLQQLHSVYREYGLTKEAEKITVKLRELGPKVNEGMGKISSSVEIPAEKVEAYIRAMLEGNLETVLFRIAEYYIPKKSDVENQLRISAEKAPFLFMIPKQIRDYEGRLIAEVGSLEKDLEGNIVSEISQNMGISTVFIRNVMTGLVQKFNLSDTELLDHIYKSPLFAEERRGILQVGVQAYLDGNALIAIHLLIPQIEAAVRNLVEQSGNSVLRESRGGGFHLRIFDDLLRAPIVARVLGEDMALYFRVLFTDQRGWNLRNDVCHGVSPIETFGAPAADRVIHALLCLAMVRTEEDIAQQRY